LRKGIAARQVVVTVAGSDSSGGAGIQADLKTISVLGGYGASVITSLTAQNSCGVFLVEHISPAMVAAQLEAVFSDLPVAMVKIGMLGCAPTIASIAERLPPVPVILDPVLISSTGSILTPPECTAMLIEKLLPRSTLITPNIPELEMLTQLPVTNLTQAYEAAQKLLHLGGRAVLVKGGHMQGWDATDLLVTPLETRTFRGPRWIGAHTHGTGCIYASAIATILAQGGQSLGDVIEAAKKFISMAIQQGFQLGDGEGPADPDWRRLVC
jgi:hydroxymethylpyrimidine kinase/phosphomethylpyrimidine kinase